MFFFCVSFVFVCSGGGGEYIFRWKVDKVFVIVQKILTVSNPPNHRVFISTQLCVDIFHALQHVWHCSGHFLTLLCIYRLATFGHLGKTLKGALWTRQANIIMHLSIFHVYFVVFHALEHLWHCLGHYLMNESRVRFANL